MIDSGDIIISKTISMKSMKYMKYCSFLPRGAVIMAKNTNFYFTTVTVGKRGQIVIPAKLRKELEINSQQQLVVMSGPNHEGFVVMKTNSFIEKQESFKKFRQQLNN